MHVTRVQDVHDVCECWQGHSFFCARLAFDTRRAASRHGAPRELLSACALMWVSPWGYRRSNKRSQDDSHTRHSRIQQPTSQMGQRQQCQLHARIGHVHARVHTHAQQNTERHRGCAQQLSEQTTRNTASHPDPRHRQFAAHQSRMPLRPECLHRRLLFCSASCGCRSRAANAFCCRPSAADALCRTTPQPPPHLANQSPADSARDWQSTRMKGGPDLLTYCQCRHVPQMHNVSSGRSRLLGWLRTTRDVVVRSGLLLPAIKRLPKADASTHRHNLLAGVRPKYQLVRARGSAARACKATLQGNAARQRCKATLQGSAQEMVLSRDLLMRLSHCRAPGCCSPEHSARRWVPCMSGFFKAQQAGSQRATH